MQFDASMMPKYDIYKLLIGSVVPRPIAWISTVDEGGRANIAPFSFFTAVSGDPPMIVFSIGNDRRNGLKKDTLANIEATKEFVVNVVSSDLAEQMNTTAAEFDPNVDEFELAGLTPVAGVQIAVPRILESPISMECRVDQMISVGVSPHILVIGEVLWFHIRDDLYDPETRRIDMHRLSPIARMAGHLYTRSDIFEMKRKEADYHG